MIQASAMDDLEDKTKEESDDSDWSEYDDPFAPTTHEESMAHLDKITDAKIKEVEDAFRKNYEENKEEIEADLKYWRDKINRE